MKGLMLLLAMVCAYLPYGCMAECHCLEIAKYKQSQWEWLLQSELDLGTSSDSPIIYYIGGCCGAYAELIEALERAQQIP